MAVQHTEEELAVMKKILRELGTIFLVIAVPYILMGVYWADQHGDHLAFKNGIEEKVNWLGEVVAWPVLIFFDLDLR